MHGADGSLRAKTSAQSHGRVHEHNQVTGHHFGTVEEYRLRTNVVEAEKIQ
jgi:hypothetical protein